MNEYVSYEELMHKLYDGSLIKTKDVLMNEMIDCNIVVDRFNLYYDYLHRPFDVVYRYLIGELSWYFSGENTIKNIMKYSVFWKKIKNNNNTVNSNYGRIVFYQKNRHKISQFNWATQQLIQDVNTRQSIILYNDKNYYYKDNKDFICTQLQHFFIRDNKIFVIVYIRSSDIILGLTYDIVWWSMVHQMIFLKLKNKYKNLSIGKMIIHGGSFHFYPNKYQTIRDIIKNNHRLNKANVIITKNIPLGKSFEWYEKNIIKYIKITQDDNNLSI